MVTDFFFSFTVLHVECNTLSFKVFISIDSSEWFLVIKSVDYSDEGVYECQIVKENHVVTQKFVLSVVGECMLHN